jgi:hypothetical protein
MDSIIVCTTRTVSCSRDVDLADINFLATNHWLEAVLGGGRRVKLPSHWTPAFCTRIQTATITGAYAGHCRTLQRLRIFTTVCTVLFAQGHMRPLDL